MKKFLIILLGGLLLNGVLTAQDHLFLEEQEITLADGKVSAWVFPATDTQEKTLEDFKEYLKERSDIKLKKEGDDMFIAEEVSLPAISTNRGDLIGLCRVTEQYYSMAIIFKMGYDISISTKEWPTEMENMRFYVKAFMTFHYERVYADRISDLEDQIKDVEKQRDQTEKQIGNTNNKIQGNTKKISKETDTGKINELNAENTTLEAEMQVLSDNLPGLLSELDRLRKSVEENKTELNAYLSTISAF